MWIYEQATGKLTHNKIYIGTGYSGLGQAKNNPDMEQIPDMGCIPRGHYTICAPRDIKNEDGEVINKDVMDLIPDFDNHMFGRFGFQIHGESSTNPGSASTGCIILAPAIRTEIWTSGDRKLEVV
jgi:hypothetical protein